MYKNTTHNILDMEKGLIIDYGLQLRDKSNKKVMGICDNFKESLSNRRRNKLDKLYDIIQTDNQEEHLADTTMRIREILDTPFAPSCSQIDQFLKDVRVEVDNKRTLVEDPGPEENLHGIKPLSIESSLIYRFSQA